MRSIIKSTLTIILVLGVCSFTQAQKTTFEDIYDLITHKNYFKAKESYLSNRDSFSKEHKYFIEAVLDNAFNKLEESNQEINMLLKNKSNLPDSLVVKLLKVSEDNAVKLFEYKKAKQASETILNNYGELLSEDEEQDLKNNLKIWTALKNTPKQTVTQKTSVRLMIGRDKAGLGNLVVSNGKISTNFIFDTGANLSTITKTTAKKFGMTLIPAEIDVGTLTGKVVQAQLAVCDVIKLGDIEINNSVFLVLEDEDLYFAPINYQINGILGFPIINALGEIIITQDGNFIIPKIETAYKYKPNMALDGLTPLIFINGMHFSFDSGAPETILYKHYYLAHKREIEEKYHQTKITLGGAGGLKEFSGYTINVTFNILDKEVHLKKVSLLSEHIKEKNYLYGNIGQDVIGQFNKMTLNFNQMFIRFD